LFAIALAAVGDGFALRMLTLADRHTSEIERLTRELELAKDENAVMEMIARNASDGLLIQDIYARIEWSNPAYTRVTGFSAEELRGRKPQELLLPPENAMSAESIAAFKYDIESGILDSIETVRNVRKNGEYFWNQLSFAVVEYEGSRDPKIIVISRDVTEQIEREENLKRAKEESQFRAEHDVLTGLPNRMKLDSFLDDALHEAGATSGEVGILHVDLDHFKEVNDMLGHAAGDAVLVHAANVMTTHTRGNDLVSRFGGDEFIIVCPGVSGFPALERMAQRVIADLRKPIPWDDKKIVLGASIGIALSNEGSRKKEELIKQSDAALYEVKNSGRNDLLSYTNEIGEIVSRRTELSASLSEAIANDQLGVVLQPQFDLSTRTVTGFEALIRWHHPQRGLLSAAQFLEVAEKNGRMVDVDAIARKGALDALCTLRDAGFPHLRMSMNVSAQMLNRPEYVDELKWEVEQRGLNPKNLAIEVLETILIENNDNATTRSISALSDAGFAVELDDFGTGYSGLANLARLKIHGVKIDRALVQDSPEDRTAQVILKAVINLCKELDLNVIAEGVEYQEQAEFLRQISGSVIQGYGVARPMSLDNAVRWLRTTDMNTVLTAPSEINSSAS
jgi:diguanylate cyclase (GGDEF)-like protein/PAS domain S-box-containing protein